jgi:hypothetical protein
MPIYVTAIDRNDPPINRGFVPTIQAQGESANLGKVVEGS